MAGASSRRSAPAEPTRRGTETPRIFTPPARELTEETTLGFEAIRFAEEVLEVTLYPWQRWLLIHALELNPDRTFRFRKVFVLVGRQNGKSTLLQVLSLWRMYLDAAPLILGTAQDRGIARDQWLGAVEIAQGVEELAQEIADGMPVTSRGFENFVLATGERYEIAASNRRAGRGKSVDLLLMDELREHTSWDAWAAVSKTTNARPKGQIWAVSNAGDAQSIVLRHFRRLAHLGLGDPDGLSADPVTGAALEEAVPDDVEDDESLAIFEWSAKPGCSIWDRDGWAQSNPSLGYGSLTERTLASDARSDPEWVYRTEVLCQWSAGSIEGPFPSSAWEGCLDNTSRRRKKSPITVCVDVSWDRSTAYIAWAGWRKDGLIHVEVAARRAGTDWVIPFIAERAEKLKVTAVTFQTNGAPVSSLVDEAKAAGLPYLPWQGPDLGKWTGLFFDRVTSKQLRHLAQPVLDIAASAASTKPAGDAWIWDRKSSPTDIAPLVAVTGAVGALLNNEPEFESAYASDDYELMVL